MFGKVFSRAIQDPGWGRWGAGVGDMPGHGGSEISPSTASQLLTVYGCITLITDVMSTMPVDHYTSATGIPVEASPRAVWLDNPNPDDDWASFISQVMWSWLIDGNVFIAPIRTSAGRVVEVHVLNPSMVFLDRQNSRTRVLINGVPYTGELLHIPAYKRPGDIRGINPIENARVALGLGMSAQEYGKGFFDNSAIPPTVISVPGNLDKNARDELRESWSMRHAGPRNAGKVGLLTGGATVGQLAISPEQSQFLETRQFSATEIAANLFHVPPDMIGVALAGSSITYQNMETRWTEFIRRACMPWMNRFEKAVSYALLPRPQYLKFCPDVYMRADTQSRYATHGIGIKHHFLTPNEARALEDLPPLPGGDEFPVLGPGKDTVPPDGGGGA